MSERLASELTAEAVRHLQHDLLPRIEKSVALLDEAELWWRPNGVSNSIGNILLHLAGNVRQWILSGLGGQPDVRTRAQEFAAREGPGRKELLEGLRETVSEACAVLDALTEDQLLKRYSIQVYEVTGVRALIHVVEHFSYHTGQILYVTKQLKNQDLGFYAALEKPEEAS